MPANVKSMLKKSLLIAGVIALLAVGYYVFSIVNFMFNIQDDSSSQKYSASNPPPKWNGKDRVNLLLLGTDKRADSKADNPRSDMMMVVSLDPPTNTAAMFSVMRDTYVDIPGYSPNRINTAMALGGPQLAMRTVSELVDLPIQYYVSTDFEGFISLVDELGGIELDVEKNMRYKTNADQNKYDIDLQKGLQVLDGTKALQYVRFRHDATSDFSRTERQRKFLSALGKEVQSATSIFKLPTLLNSIEPHIQTNLSFVDMTKLAVMAHGFDTSDIPGMQVPPTELITDTRVNGASVLAVDRERLQPVIKDFIERSANRTAKTENKTKPAADQES